jgi:hypothetical protein
MDPYLVLGVRHECTAEEVKDRFRTLAMQVHPDHGGDELAFIRVSNAYKQILREMRLRPRSSAGPRAEKPATMRDPRAAAGRTVRTADPNFSPDVVLLPKPPNPEWAAELVVADPDSAVGSSPPKRESARLQDPNLNWFGTLDNAPPLEKSHWVVRWARAGFVAMILYIMICVVAAGPLLIFAIYSPDITPGSDLRSSTFGLAALIITTITPILPSVWLANKYVAPFGHRRHRHRNHS